MKISPEIRQQDLAQHVKKQLEFIPVEDVKSSVIVMVLVMFDIPLLLGLLSIFELEFLYILSPFILILHLWGIRLIIKKPYSTQFEMVLFIGVWGLCGAISLFVTVLGMSYYTIHITSVLYYITISVTTILLTYILVKYQKDKYSDDPTKEKNWKPIKIYGNINYFTCNRIYGRAKCAGNDCFTAVFFINYCIHFGHFTYVCSSEIFTSILFYESKYGLC